MLKTIWLGTYSDLAKKLNCVSGYWDRTSLTQEIFKTQNTTLTFFPETGIIWCHGTQEEMLIGLLQDYPISIKEPVPEVQKAARKSILHIETMQAEQLEILKALHITITEQLKK